MEKTNALAINVTPAKAGVQCLYIKRRWIPAFAGMTASAGKMIFGFKKGRLCF